MFRKPMIGRPLALSLFVVVWSTGCHRSDQAAPRSEVKSAARPAPAQAQAPAVPLDPLTRGWALGQPHVYGMTLSTTITFAGGGQTYDFDLMSTVDVVPQDVTPERTTLYIGIRDARVVSRAPGTQGEIEAAAAELRASGALVTLSGGRVSELRVPAGLSQMAAST